MIRLFLAVQVSRELKDRYAAFHAAADKRLRWVKPENIHFTLRFLGDTEERLLEPLRAGMEAAARPLRPFKITVGSGGCFGPRNFPQVLWFTVQEGLAELQALALAVESAVVGLGFPKEEKEWRAHLTLARNPRRVRFEGWESQLEAIGISGMSVEVREVTLFSSKLRSQGPEYSVVWQAPLAGPADLMKA